LYYFLGGGGGVGGGFGLVSDCNFGSRGTTVEGFGFAACCLSSGRFSLAIILSWISLLRLVVSALVE
jgi:hypothetical protein